MICVIIPGPNMAKAQKTLENLPPEINLIEFRLDLIEDWTLLNLEHLRNKFPELNIIFTLRSVGQGGLSSIPVEERVDILRELSTTNPKYVDIEFGTPPELIQQLKDANPRTKIILSHHDFAKTPNLSELLAQMQKIPADVYKIAAYFNSTTDALKALLFQRDNPGVLITGMGVYGKPTRVLGPIFGAPFVYASTDDNSLIPGQISAPELINKFNFLSLTPQSRIYALIGEPLERSPSTAVYNALFKKNQIPAVYVKLPIKENAVDEFFEIIKKMPVDGLSVTSPVKESVFSKYSSNCDENTKKIGAVNTFVFKEGTAYCYNTDGIGSADAIEKFGPLENKKMLIIGAGGAVKALIKEAMKRGAIVIILNRTPERAQKAASELGCFWDDLSNFMAYYRDGYDILVNGTSVQPIEDDMILPNSIVFDFQVFPTDTKLLSAARKKNCKIVNGYEMWINQGEAQCAYWFGEDPGRKEFMQAILKKAWDLPEF